MKSLTLKQYTITIGVSTFGDLEEAGGSINEMETATARRAGRLF